MKYKNISKELFSYLIAGGLTTLINFAVYYILIYFQVEYIISNTIAFIASVLFAFIINKKYVFLSDKGYLNEFIKFVVGRGLTYILDIGCMIVLVEYLSVGEYVSKIWANILVIVANYFISKFWTFK